MVNKYVGNMGNFVVKLKSGKPINSILTQVLKPLRRKNKTLLMCEKKLNKKPAGIFRQVQTNQQRI